MMSITVRQFHYKNSDRGAILSRIQTERWQLAKCTACGMFLGMGGNVQVEFNGMEYCQACADIAKDKVIDGIIISTTHNLDGYKVVKYIDIESVEFVIGTGFISEFGGNISDFFGSRSTGFEKKIADAKQAAFTILKRRAVEKKGNAVIGIDMDFTEFSGNRIGLILNGTIVSIKPIEP